jgi:hypothetical protein
VCVLRRLLQRAKTIGTKPQAQRPKTRSHTNHKGVEASHGNLPSFRQNHRQKQRTFRRSGDTLTNHWDGLTHDYSRKGWIEHTEILLPEHAPEEFKNRSALWNAVEKAEKSGSAQLAREIEIALPKELNQAGRLSLIRDFIEKNFVSAGMCADFAVHNPPVTDSRNRPVDQAGNPTRDKDKMIFRNPHVHIMLTMRPLDRQGQWQAKSQTAYLCRKNNEERSVLVSEIKQAETDGWQKQYQYKIGRKKVWLTKEAAEKKGFTRVSKQPKTEKIQNPVTAQWNSKDALFQWRKSWAELCNEQLKRNGIEEQISHLSYEAQGINKVASVHMGVEAVHAEKRGIPTELGELNRQIQRDNEFLAVMEGRIREWERRETESLNRTAARLEGIRSRHIAAAYQQLCLSISLAKEQDSLAAQMRAAAAMAETAEHLIRAIGALKESLDVYRRQREETNPFQKQKRKELEEKVMAAEHQIQNLKTRLNEIQSRQREVKTAPVSSPEAARKKKEQIQYLKEIQSQAYREFYTLVKENKENMNRIREIIQGSRNEHDSQLKQRLKEHYTEDFQEKILEQARDKAPEIPETEGASIQKNIFHKR